MFLPDKCTTSSNSFLFFPPSVDFHPSCQVRPSLLSLHSYGLSFFILSLLTCCSIEVRVSFPLKPSPTFGSASPWRGIPYSEGSGCRQAAVRRDQIRTDQTDRWTELQEKTDTLHNRRTLQQCVLLISSPMKPSSEITAVPQLFLSLLMTIPILGFSLSLSLSGCRINLDYTLSFPDWITGCMTSDDTDHRNQRATQTSGLIPGLYIPSTSISVCQL